MYFRIIATLALSFVFYIGSSQVSYHRLYETMLNDQSGMNDTIFYHMSSTTISGDVYAMGTKRVLNGTAQGYEDLSVVFTKHDDKGNEDWSQELDLGQDTVKFLGLSSIGDFAFNGTQDSILFTIEVEINGNRSELFGKLDANGNEIDLKTVGGIPFTVASGFPKVAPFITQSDLLLTSGVRPTLSRIGLGDDLIWSISCEFLNTSGDSSLSSISDVTSTSDSTIVLSGFGAGIGREFVVAELDSNGVQLWAESYTFDINDLATISPEVVEPLSDGTFAVAGSYFTTSSAANGFVAIVDSAGTILMTKRLYISEESTVVSDMIEGADGTLWMSGSSVILDTSRYFTTNMNLDGTVNWTTVYPGEVTGFGNRERSLLNVESTGGATLVVQGLLDDLPVLEVMKHDPTGNTSCSDTISIVLEDIMVLDDTLTSSFATAGIFLDSIDFELNSFDGFDIPTLSITQYPPFCPNEFIDTILVASVSGSLAEENISYLWSTEETNDTIGIMVQPMMMPQYSVTVTIREDVCYTMCDTVEITRSILPGVIISQDDSRYCEERIIVLNANYMEGSEDGETYLWSTGATTPSIEVMDVGPYSVTITDGCGDQAEDVDFDVTFPQYNPDVQFGPSVMTFCETGTVRLTTSYQGGGDEPVFEWSDGQIGDTIFVNTSGEYTVSVTDECGLTDNFTLQVDLPIIATEATISSEPNCEINKIVFSTTNEENINLVVIQIDEDGDRTVVTNQANSFDLGNYVVIARDLCGNDIDSLSQNSTAICGGLLQYPIAFFPGGQDMDSRTFGPIPNDTLSVGELISDLEFKVFNRWGETVFESNDLLDAWDGSHKGDPAPSEVYIWYVSYIVEGVQMLDKGDVTLIR